MNQIHFCGGLPRSGTTLLMNILQQNPRIFTTGTCALQEIIRDKILIKGRIAESFQAMSTKQSDKAMYGLVHGATKGWFEALTDKPTVISKRHGASGLLHIFPNSKFICMIRDIRDIVESFDRVNEKVQALHSFSDNGTLLPAMHEHEKFKYFFEMPNALGSNLMIEIPRAMELFSRNPERVFFLRYEDFTRDPVYILKKLYEFLEEDYFEHDLNNIAQSELFEHDHAYFRERTDHEVYPEFKYYQKPKRKMSEEFSKKILKDFAWFYGNFYKEEMSFSDRLLPKKQQPPAPPNYRMS